MRSSRYEARGKFGGHERCVRVARGVAESTSSFLCALQTSQVLHISMNTQLTSEPIVLKHFQPNGLNVVKGLIFPLLFRHAVNDLVSTFSLNCVILLYSDMFVLIRQFKAGKIMNIFAKHYTSYVPFYF